VESRKYWLGFSLVPEIGPKRLNLLLKTFGDLRSAWQAPESALRDAGLEQQPLANLLRTRARLDLDREYAKLEAAGASLITLEDESYPPLLKSLLDAPSVLYVRGTLLPEDNLAVGIVGTRRATAYGRDAAAFFSRQLVQNGVTIVSGLAYGIDAAAHHAAIDAGGRTLAVLGCGVDQIYPRDHGDLMAQIAQHGALISEFPLGTRPDPSHFPRRNRIISGLSLGILVVEAPEKSGALITAAIALEQGREVFAVPGNIFSPASAGTNRLIQDGAKPIMSVDDILGEINVTYRNVEVRTAAREIAPPDETEAALLKMLGADPMHIDDLTRLTGLPIALVTSTLTLLELKGVVNMVGHMQYCVNVHR
jgi:DNA processing protein